MIVGICKLALYIPESHSLKEKRSAVKRIKDRAFQTFKVAVNEVEANDMWQTAYLGFAVVGSERAVVEGLVQKMANYIEGLGLAEVVDHCVEFVNI